MTMENSFKMNFNMMGGSSNQDRSSSMSRNTGTDSREGNGGRGEGLGLGLGLGGGGGGGGMGFVGNGISGGISSSISNGMSNGGNGSGSCQMSMMNDRQLSAMGRMCSDSGNNMNMTSFQSNNNSSTDNGPFNAFPDPQPQIAQMVRKRQTEGFDDEPAAKRPNFSNNARQDSFNSSIDARQDSFNNNSGEPNELNLIPPSKDGIKFYSRNDVLCGRGGGTNVHPGNRRFRDLINANRRAYLKARKNDKPAISRSIVRTIREMNGRFLKKDEKLGLWFEIGDDGAREKTSQALRQRAPEMRKILFEDEQRQQHQQEAMLQRRLMAQNIGGVSNNSMSMSNQMSSFGQGQSQMNSMSMRNQMGNMGSMNMTNMGNRGNFGPMSPTQCNSSSNISMSEEQFLLQRRLMNQSMNMNISSNGRGQSSQMGSSMGSIGNISMGGNNMRNFRTNSPSQGNSNSLDSNEELLMQNRSRGSFNDNVNASPQGSSNNNSNESLLARYNMFQQKNLLAQEKNMLLQRLAMSGLNPQTIQNHQSDIDNMTKQTLLGQNFKQVTPRGA